MLLYLDYATNVHTGMLSSLQAKILIGFLAVTFAMTVAYSRLVLNVHTINQVFYGLHLGLWFAFTVHFCVRPRLFKHIRSIITHETNRF